MEEKKPAVILKATTGQNISPKFYKTKNNKGNKNNKSQKSDWTIIEPSSIKVIGNENHAPE